MSTTTDELAGNARLADLNGPAPQIEAYMGRFLDQRPLAANLREAIRYSLLGQGKRLRPILVIRACEAVGGRSDQALAPASAIEMVHCFSLVHDDLPAMDDDDLRRGRATLHVHTNEAMAILAGDAMLGLAFELIATKVEPTSKAAGLLRELSTATNDMITGQVYDTLPQFDAGIEPIDRLRTVHRHKTSALIRGACRMGAICGEASEGQLEAITIYGEAIGLMFQVIDDLLDVTQSTEQLGKASHKDAQQGKLTYPSVLGMEASRREVQRLHGQAVEALRTFGDRARPLIDLGDYMAVRTR